MSTDALMALRPDTENQRAPAKHTLIQRLPLKGSNGEDYLTPMQTIVVALLGQGKNYTEIGELLDISERTAKEHANAAAAKMPGDLPTQFRIVAWFRGDDGTVLLGDKAKQAAAGRGDPLLTGRPYIPPR